MHRMSLSFCCLNPAPNGSPLQQRTKPFFLPRKVTSAPALPTSVPSLGTLLLLSTLHFPHQLSLCSTNMPRSLLLRAFAPALSNPGRSQILYGPVAGPPAPLSFRPTHKGHKEASFCLLSSSQIWCDPVVLGFISLPEPASL